MGNVGSLSVQKAAAVVGGGIAYLCDGVAVLMEMFTSSQDPSALRKVRVDAEVVLFQDVTGI